MIEALKIRVLCKSKFYDLDEIFYEQESHGIFIATSIKANKILVFDATKRIDERVSCE
jgi:hypothetical protein